MLDIDTLRTSLAAQRLRSPEDLMRELLVAGSPYSVLLDVVLSVRVYERTRLSHTVNVALAELRTGTPKRWVSNAIRQCFAIYCALRRSAVPHGAHHPTPNVACIVIQMR